MDDILTPSTLTLQRERTLFVITLVISCLIWLVCVVTIFPILGLAIGGFVMWFLHGLLIGRIKSEAVKAGCKPDTGFESGVFGTLFATEFGPRS